MKTNPLLLLDNYQHPKYEEYANSFLKNDTGIEWEVAYKKSKPKKIPDCVSYDDSTDGSGYPEKRFRITGGIKGLIQLFKISAFMKEHCVFNPDACIHVHVSCDYNKITEWATIRKKQFSILQQHSVFFDQEIVRRKPIKNKTLSYSAWVAYSHKFNTLEVRAVPMTFEYSELLHYVAIMHRLVYKLNHC